MDSFKSSPEALVITNARDEIANINPMAEIMFGYKREELIDKCIEALIPDRLKHRHSHQRKEYRSHPTEKSMGMGVGIMGRHKNGDEFPVKISLSPKQLSTGYFITVAIEKLAGANK